MDLIERIVDRILRSDLSLERSALEQTVPEIVAEEAPLAGRGTVQAVIDAVVGLGPIEELLRDPNVSDVLVNRFDDVWVERSGRLQRSQVVFPGPEAVVAAVERVLGPLGLRLDLASPIVDARLPDGSRLHAAIPPVAVDGPVVTVRRFTRAVPDLDGLVGAEGITTDGAERLRRAVRSRKNLIVVGGTGTGKTTLLNLLSTEIPPDERIVVVEDATELALHGHVVRLESRPPNPEGRGEVNLRQLVRAALRLRPDRLVVGEVRGPEAFDLVAALATGHAGSMSTLHASSAGEALWRLEVLALTGASGMDPVALRHQIRSAVDTVVLVTRRRGQRRVESITEVDPERCEEVYCA
jgi:pilus assembly protein CpaF